MSCRKVSLAPSQGYQLAPSHGRRADSCRSPPMGWTGCFPRRDSLQRLPAHPEKQPMDTPSAPLASIGIDIGKEVFHVVGFGTDGKIAFRRKIKRLASYGLPFIRQG